MHNHGIALENKQNSINSHVFSHFPRDNEAMASSAMDINTAELTVTASIKCPRGKASEMEIWWNEGDTTASQERMGTSTRSGRRTFSQKFQFTSAQAVLQTKTTSSQLV